MLEFMKSKRIQAGRGIGQFPPPPQSREEVQGRVGLSEATAKVSNTSRKLKASLQETRRQNIQTKIVNYFKNKPDNLGVLNLQRNKSVLENQRAYKGENRVQEYCYVEIRPDKSLTKSAKPAEEDTCGALFSGKK